MKFGFPFISLHPGAWAEVAQAADEAGFESCWIADHLVFPVEMEGSLGDVDHPNIPPTVPVFDGPAYLSYLAGLTSRINLGVYVYLAGLRHPFATARSFSTLDHVSNGRALAGVGAGWLRNEWTAAGMDPRTRGRRLDEALDVCVRLWTEPVVEHHGEFYDFEPVAFEPKPVQQPHPPVLVGGLSDAALRRAARFQGWMGMSDTFESVRAAADRLADLGSPTAEITAQGRCETVDDLRRWEDAGAHRLVVTPWDSTSGAVDAVWRFAERFIS
ncbi:TIGR03619 family F420-dependent LLM class oxidoreductase [Candidatus Poriferisocius sp.]|uniref:TIGR03619 family F420-dependent LLM class oxidoreductase n=1 Tax=Candidatus Poriferisocius sp. TaxID=3101276 RepID=UPI003B01406B